MDSKAFLGKRRDRTIATLLSFKEREVDSYLPEDVSLRLRKAIMDQVNELVDTAFDLLGAGMNQEYLDRIDALYEVMVGDSNGGSG